MAIRATVIRGDVWAQRLKMALVSAGEPVEEWMQSHGRLIKSDENSRVSLLQLDGELCYLKYYRAKSAAQKFLFRLGHGRGVRSFDMGCRLDAAGIPVPRGRACLRIPDGIVLLTEGIDEGRDLKALWLDQPGKDFLARLMAEAGSLMARLHREGFSHGDCKWSNWLWSGRQFYLVDLEAVARSAVLSGRQLRDLARFTVNGEDMGLDPEIFEFFLDNYTRGLGVPRSDVLQPLGKTLGKLRQRHVEKYGARGHRLV